MHVCVCVRECACMCVRVCACMWHSFAILMNTNFIVCVCVCVCDRVCVCLTCMSEIARSQPIHAVLV